MQLRGPPARNLLAHVEILSDISRSCGYMKEYCQSRISLEWYRLQIYRDGGIYFIILRDLICAKRMLYVDVKTAAERLSLTLACTMFEASGAFTEETLKLGEES
jgi:hypothetical protein